MNPKIEQAILAYQESLRALDAAYKEQQRLSDAARAAHVQVQVIGAAMDNAFESLRSLLMELAP